MVMELAPQSLDYGESGVDIVYSISSRIYLLSSCLVGVVCSVIHEAKADFEYDYINVLHWVYQLAGALDYCHTKKPKVIHRDVKPPKYVAVTTTIHVHLWL